MLDKRKGKMTDAEILKAFECCCGDDINGTHCKDCPAEKYNFDWCSDEVSRQMVDYTKRLQAENAALCERLNKAVELPVPLGAFAICIRKISVWDGVPPKKHFKWVLAEELFTIDDIPNTGRLWFPNTEEGRKQAKARLRELQGEST